MDRTRMKEFLPNVSLHQHVHAATSTHRGLSQAISHQKYTVKPTATFDEKQVFISGQPSSINLEVRLVQTSPLSHRGPKTRAGQWGALQQMELLDPKRLWKPKAWRHRAGTPPGAQVLSPGSPGDKENQLRSPRVCIPHLIPVLACSRYRACMGQDCTG